MKKIFLLIAAFILILSGATNSYAAFPIHSHQSTVTNTTVTPTENKQQLSVNTQVVTHKQSFVSHLLQKLSGGAAISKGLYIVLSIIAFGWLAMGLNDNFTGSHWIICLILDLLIWPVGIIYALIKMKDYY